MYNFQEKARLVHGETYDYGQVNYVNGSTKVGITCSRHGCFYQTPKSHLSGSGCPLCANERRGRTDASSKEGFVLKARAVHGDLYGYDSVVYRNRYTKVKIECFSHGVFEQSPLSHLRGPGCPECARERVLDRVRESSSSVIARAMEVHGEYEYLRSGRVTDKWTILCPRHGEFEQRMHNHLAGNRCPKCAKNISKEELGVVFFIKSLTRRRLVLNDRKALSGLEIDIYIPGLKLGIEYNGNLFHSTYFGKPAGHHQRKMLAARKRGVRLIQIRSDQWRDSRGIVESILRCALGKASQEITVDECNKELISLADYRSFMDENHIQGYCEAALMLGLFRGKRLVAAAGIDSGELVRFCAVRDAIVLGALQRLVEGHEGLFSYCCLDYFDGQEFVDSGFKECEIVPPSYGYVRSSGRGEFYSRQEFESTIAPNLSLSLCGGAPEEDLCNKKGFYRLYSSGELKLRQESK